MITRSIKSTNPNSSKKSSNTHKSPVFECGCFDCYTSYWFRWDTSPNRELIHQAIEAFEENLNKSEQSKKKGKKKDKMTHRRFAGKVIDLPEQYDVASHLTGKTIELPESQYDVAAHRKLAGKVIEVPELNDVAAQRRLAGKIIEPQHDVALVEPETEAEAEAGECAAGDGELLNAVAEDSPDTTAVKAAAAAATVTANQQNRGLGRKVLPDVTGLLNWRSWSIWSPK